MFEQYKKRKLTTQLTKELSNKTINYRLVKQLIMKGADFGAAIAGKSYSNFAAIKFYNVNDFDEKHLHLDVALTKHIENYFYKKYLAEVCESITNHKYKQQREKLRNNLTKFNIKFDEVRQKSLTDLAKNLVSLNEILIKESYLTKILKVLSFNKTMTAAEQLLRFNIKKAKLEESNRAKLGIENSSINMFDAQPQLINLSSKRFVTGKSNGHENDLLNFAALDKNLNIGSQKVTWATKFKKLLSFSKLKTIFKNHNQKKDVNCQPKQSPHNSTFYSSNIKENMSVDILFSKNSESTKKIDVAIENLITPSNILLLNEKNLNHSNLNNETIIFNNFDTNLHNKSQQSNDFQETSF